jgi:hypothetical protein
LLQPAGAEKRGYRTAAKWLKDNTDREDIVAVPDTRIGFYAERDGLMYDKDVPEEAKYAVRIVQSQGETATLDRPAQEEYSVGVDKRQKNGKKIVIYRMI